MLNNSSNLFIFFINELMFLVIYICIYMPNMQTLAMRKSMLIYTVVVFNHLQSHAESFIGALDKVIVI